MQHELIDIKAAAHNNTLQKELDRLARDYEGILHTAISIINAINEYHGKTERVSITQSTDIDADQAKRDFAFSQSLGAWPSVTDNGVVETVPVTTKFNLRDYPGNSFQPL